MISSRSMDGRTVCVTGASSGIGQGISQHLGALGAHVFMMGRTTEPMEQSAARIVAAGGRADVDTFDLTDSDALQGWIRHAAESTGRLDVLVNNAGLADVGTPIIDGDPSFWQAMFDVNVIAAAIGCQAAIAQMRASGSDGNIVNISSIAALRRNSGVYGATKHALNCISATLREELENDPIRVTTIMPGVFATNIGRSSDAAMINAMMSAAGIDSPEIDEQGRIHPKQIDRIQAALATTMGNVEHIARAVEYVIAQPIEINIEELVVRPQKSLL